MEVRIAFHRDVDYEVTVYRGEVTDDESARRAIVAAYDQFRKEHPDVNFWDGITVDYQTARWPERVD